MKKTTPDAGLDLLQTRAVSEVSERGIHEKRPTWAPFVALPEELGTILRDIGWLKPDDPPVARVKARFTSPRRYGDVLAALETTCQSFELSAGKKTTGKRIFFADHRQGRWTYGPKYLHPAEWKRPRHDALTLKVHDQLVRCTELARKVFSDFVAAPDDQMRIGARVAMACNICGKALTDAISVEHGIGPECRRWWKPVAPSRFDKIA